MDPGAILFLLYLQASLLQRSHLKVILDPVALSLYLRPRGRMDSRHRGSIVRGHGMLGHGIKCCGGALQAVQWLAGEIC